VGEAKVDKCTAKGPGLVTSVASKLRTGRAAGDGPASKAAKTRHAMADAAAEKRALKIRTKGNSIRYATDEVPDGLPKKYFLKSTFNTHDIMHSPVEKTLKMLDEILSGDRLFTM